MLSERPSHPPITLLCVGGPKESIVVYRELATQLGLSGEAVMLLDRVSSTTVPCYIRACDVVTIPSPNTTHFAHFVSPLKLFEYLAAGSVIVATDLPSAREILVDNETAVFALDNSPNQLVKAFERVLNSTKLCDHLSKNARIVAQSYDWSVRAQEILLRLKNAPLPTPTY